MNRIGNEIRPAFNFIGWPVFCLVNRSSSAGETKLAMMVVMVAMMMMAVTVVIVVVVATIVVMVIIMTIAACAVDLLQILLIKIECYVVLRVVFVAECAENTHDVLLLFLFFLAL